MATFKDQLLYVLCANDNDTCVIILRETLLRYYNLTNDNKENCIEFNQLYNVNIAQETINNEIIYYFNKNNITTTQNINIINKLENNVIYLPKIDSFFLKQITSHILNYSNISNNNNNKILINKNINVKSLIYNWDQSFIKKYLIDNKINNLLNDDYCILCANDNITCVLILKEAIIMYSNLLNDILVDKDDFIYFYQLCDINITQETVNNEIIYYFLKDENYENHENPQIENNIIPLPNVSNTILKYISAYITHHYYNKQDDIQIEKPLPIDISLNEIICEWDNRFIYYNLIKNNNELDNYDLFECIQAANFLSMTIYDSTELINSNNTLTVKSNLLDLCSSAIADLIRNKSPEEVRNILHIEYNQDTEEENRKFMEEFDWINKTLVPLE
jgi:hypothetical protein